MIIDHPYVKRHSEAFVSTPWANESWGSSDGGGMTSFEVVVYNQS